MAEKEEKPKEEKAKTEERPADDPVLYTLPIRIPLKRPIYDGEREITEFVIKREPIGADWSGVNLSNVTVMDIQRVASRLMCLPLPIIRKADTKATFRLNEVIGAFLD